MAQSKSSKRKKAVKPRLRHSLCTVCGGPREEGRATLSYKLNGGWVIIENVPASICRLCGEKYFTPAVSERILEIARNTPTPTKTITIPVIVFDAA